ncbi:GNAT family N-acetyltransferase [Simiduia aestuariiviva]|uniref:GNAT superfamily N-acetyltransferase n=1 Tax=Simiduia aestuariiviva TaxID=1510459 RepID=A0A839UGI7_9GAMM|nr:GNAT family N-acetyltransferase [Simiduia aestuariiviva]MBB3167002.1 GNAT superfamily N-acetyltransferase [Simiduia aestuariiviva]
MKIVHLTWEETIPIRHKVLWPNKPPAFCKIDGDETALHYGVEIDLELVCVASVYVDSEGARLRKFATLAEYQNRGVGSALLKRMLEDARSSKVKRFWFDARESALAFYSRFGFVAEGARFFKEDVPYFRMSINL